MKEERMKFIKALVLALPLLAAASCSSAEGFSPNGSRAGMERAWRLWKDGDVEGAAAAARSLPESPRRDHLLFNCAYAAGDYEGALAMYADMDPAFKRRRDIVGAVVELYRHLGRYADAASFSSERGFAGWEKETLRGLADAPLSASLDETIIIPFEAVPMGGVDLSDSLPGVAAELEGIEITAHFDSGGAFLVMSPSMAKSLGIGLIEGGKAFAALSTDRTFYGIAKRFRIGKAILENVPVTAIPQLSGPMDRVIFGTNVLERFLSTVDFPARRLVLSPRGDAEAAKRHYAALGSQRSEAPFYLWGDHFMYARGTMGDDRGMNFFIDSGLFFVVMDSDGAPRRGSFMADKDHCLRWGMGPEDAKRGWFESGLNASLGGVVQERPYIVLNSMKEINDAFGGVRIDALLSNGFLGGYAWTIDFDRRVYVFSRP
jgi:hypothetical protein